MHASDGRRWFEGVLPDPEERRYCHVFTAIAGIGSLFGFGAADLGIGAGLLGGSELLGLGGAEAAGAGLAGAAADFGGGGAALGVADQLGLGLGAGDLAGSGGGGILGGLFDAGGALGPAGDFGGGGAALGVPDQLGLNLGAADLAGGVGGAGSSGLLDAFGFGGSTPGGEFFGSATGAAQPGAVGLGPISTAPDVVAPAATAISPAPGAGGAAAVLPPGIPGSPAATGAFEDTIALGDFSARPAATAASAATGGGGGLTSGLDKLVGGATGGLLNTKDLGLLTSIGGLGMNLLNRNQPIPGEKQINQAAGGLTATAGAQANKGMQLESFVNSGTLPPGLADGLKTATAAAEASIKSSHAKSGTTGSSAEAQDIQAAHERAQTAAAQVALQLLQQGSSMVGQAVNTEAMAANLYNQIMANALSQDEALGKAIGNFAGALSGAGGSNRGNMFTITGAS